MIRFWIVVRNRFATHFQRGIPAARAAPGIAGASRGRGRPRPRGSARPCAGSAPARTGRRGGASRRHRRRAGGPACSRSSGCRRSRSGAGARPARAAASRASSTVSSVEESSTRMISSTCSSGIASKVSRRVAAACRAGITTTILAVRFRVSAGASATSRLDVDRSAPPQGDLDRGPRERHGRQRDPGRDRRGAWCGCDCGAPCRRLAQAW